MGVYIPKITIPEYGCACCLFCVEDEKREFEWKCLFLDRDITTSDCLPEDDCPLVEVKPHGRLIDADALHIDLIDRGIADIHTNDWYEIRQAVDDAPTIIEADDSIKRAEWEKHNDGIMYWWECSKCHHDAWYDGDDLYNYCPWCGAKMTIIESEGEDG